MSEWNEKPLVAGSLTGLRAFKVDRLGRLVSPLWEAIFRPGENVAECRAKTVESMSAAMAQVSRKLSRMTANPYAYHGAGGEDREPEPVPEPKPKHAAGNIGCRCGWYAYTNGDNPYLTDMAALWGTANRAPTLPRVAALVEGWGTCTLGTNGFRAEKAQAVALVTPELDNHDWRDGRFERLLNNYPDVPAYSSIKDALDKHPLSVPEIPTPETHPDFWEMEVKS